jgi:hypothetical protein
MQPMSATVSREWHYQVVAKHEGTDGWCYVVLGRPPELAPPWTPETTFEHPSWARESITGGVLSLPVTAREFDELDVGDPVTIRLTVP